MGLEAALMGWWLARKQPEDLARMITGMMPKMSDRLGAETSASMMTAMMEHCSATMPPEDMERIIHDVMPRMMDACFARMDAKQRESVIAAFRHILGGMESEYLKEAVN